MRAVATVVMNRVRIPYGEYQRVGQGDVRKVIFQPGQFDCVREVIRGEYNPQNIYNSNPDQVHYDIADWALSGNRLFNVGYSLWYLNPFVPECPPEFPYNGTGYWLVRLREHCFYNPTELYAET